MAPVVYLVRHAQGYHNLSHENEQLPDPDLTPLGETQCAELCARFPAHDRLTHLVASPLRRTLHTCLQSFAPAAARGLRVVALPDAQEVSLQPCDHGSAPERLRAEFGDRADLALVRDGWNDKSPQSRYYPEPAKLEARARDARLWLRDLVREAGDDAQVVLVTHGGILHFLTEDWDNYQPGKEQLPGDKLSTGWTNTECRAYEFADPTYQDPGASLKETQASWRQRRGSAVPLTETEQMQMKQAFSDQLKQDLAAL